LTAIRQWGEVSTYSDNQLLTTKGSRKGDHVVRMLTFYVERLIRANTQDVHKTMPKSQKMAH